MLLIKLAPEAMGGFSETIIVSDSFLDLQLCRLCLIFVTSLMESFSALI
jgi:hypothetical protein